MVRALRPICFCLSLVAMAFGSPSGATYAQGGGTPTPDGADARDTPTPVYADGTPGQYVLTNTQWSQPGGKNTPLTITYSFQNMFDGALKMPNGQPLPAS